MFVSSSFSSVFCKTTCNWHSQTIFRSKLPYTLCKSPSSAIYTYPLGFQTQLLFRNAAYQKYCTIFMPHFQSFPVEICQIFYELFGFLIQWQYGTNNLKIKTLNQFFNNIKALKKKKRQNLKNKTLVQQTIFTLQKFHKQRKS